MKKIPGSLLLIGIGVFILLLALLDAVAGAAAGDQTKCLDQASAYYQGCIDAGGEPAPCSQAAAQYYERCIEQP